MKHADVLVVGLGAMGSATAYQLAKAGTKVVGIDQFTPPHVFGSTHGDSRITRQAVGEGAAYVPFVLRSHELWREIGALTGTEILNECGVLMMRPAAVKAAQHGVPDRFATTVEVAKSFGIAHEVFDGAEVRRRYPELIADDSYRAYFEPGGGFVHPEGAVSAQLQLAARHGAELRCGERVIEVSSDGSGTVVKTDKDTYIADRVVAAAGPWMGDMFPDPGLAGLFSVYRQVQHWFPVDQAKIHAFSPERFPVFIWTFGDDPSDYMYGFPAIDGDNGGMKIATEHWAQTTTADSVDRSVSAEEPQQMFDHCIKGRIPAVSPNVLRSAACLYTVTPDYRFVIDEHPKFPGVLLVSPCSGHGFKHSAAIGESVAQQIMGIGSTIDLSSFSLSRFSDGLSAPRS